jgi:hypothetical protein
VHDFVIANEGDAELVVDEVVAGCACTAATLDPTIPPHTQRPLHVVLDPSHLAGPIAKQIVLATNDPASPQSLLTLRAVVRPPLAAAPSVLHVEGVQGESEPPGAVTVFASDRDDLEVRGVDAGGAPLIVRYHEATATERAPAGHGRQWRLEAAVEPRAPLGPIAALLTVSTNRPDGEPLVVPVVGAQHKELELTPPTAALGSIAVGDRRVLRLVNRSAAAIAVLDVSTDIPALGAAVRALPDGKSFDIDLVLVAGLQPGRLAGTLSIRTTSAHTPVLAVPITGLLR